MSERSTFGGTWTRPTRSGVGRSRRELQDRASFDQAPASGCVSCLLALPVSLAMWWGIYEAAAAVIGVIA